jgi:hypothetical protein
MKAFLYDENDMCTIIQPSLNPGERQAVLITHDESTFYNGECRHWYWMENGKRKIPPKSKGQSLMISGFVCQCHGFMSNADNKVKTYTLFEAGKNRQGWFTNADLIDQFMACKNLIKDLHPDMDIYVAFDNSNTHRAKPPDGLDVTQLNLSDGGARVQGVRIRDGFYFDDCGNRIVHSMMKADGSVK